MDPLLDDPSIRVDVWSNIAGGAVRLTHMPTGASATKTYTRRGEPGHDANSSIWAKELAARELREKLATATPRADGFVLVSGVSGNCVWEQPR
jgi:hypothetical protein